MYEPITLVRKRDKKGQPGKWEILLGPDRPTSEHIEAHRKLLSESPGLVNDDVAQIIVARLENMKSTVTFKTADEAAAHEKALKEFEAKNAASKKDAKAREEKQAKEVESAASAEQKKRVEEISKLNDEARAANNK